MFSNKTTLWTKFQNCQQLRSSALHRPPLRHNSTRLRRPLNQPWGTNDAHGFRRQSVGICMDGKIQAMESGRQAWPTPHKRPAGPLRTCTPGEQITCLPIRTKVCQVTDTLVQWRVNINLNGRPPFLAASSALSTSFFFFADEGQAAESNASWYARRFLS